MIKIRVATKQDLIPWAAMRAELWKSASAEEHLAELKEFFGQETFQGWVGVEGEDFVGFTEASIRPYANGCETRPVAFLEGIWVHPNFREKGVGRKFVHEVEVWARSKGLKELGSDAELANLVSQSCHRKWGFVETERVVYYRKKLGERTL